MALKRLSYAARAARYAKAVTAGKVTTGKLVHAACQRHLGDLERAKAKDYPYRFDAQKAHQICMFAENMIHIKGKWASAIPGKLPLIHLEDWQCFLFAVPFGWVRKSDGLRRFREIYSEIPRKNSKSTCGAIIGLYMAFADGEIGAEVFAGATSLEQARAVFRPAWLMVRNNPEFRAHFGLELSGTETHPGSISQLSTGSSFKSIIGKPGDGDSPHCAIIDEYHEHSDSTMYDTMKTGMGARSQPMRVVITTAGVDTSGPCYDKHLEAIKVLQGTLENDELFTVIFGIDVESEADAKSDDWTDFEMWKKANPNYGVSVFDDYLRGQLRDAMQSPSQQNINRTKHLNEWMNAGVAWMNMALWDRCKDNSLHLESFARMKCWLGMDLATKIDLACLSFMFKLDNDVIVWFCKHYLPEETIELPQNAHYRKWRDDPRGWLTQTDGAVTDFNRIEDDIKDAGKMFDVQSLAYDEKESTMLITSIRQWASFDCIAVQQAPVHFNEPMQQMEALIYGGKMKHAGDPVLTWQMGNVVKKAARGGGEVKYYYPTKQKPGNKIDGVVAGIMGLSRVITHKPKTQYKIHVF